LESSCPTTARLRSKFIDTVNSVLAKTSRFMLGLQPPTGQRIPLVGWHLTDGDIGPAQYLEAHAHQRIPLLGLVPVVLQTKGLHLLVADALLRAA
jgi:hypothetical protein